MYSTCSFSISVFIQDVQICIKASFEAQLASAFYTQNQFPLFPIKLQCSQNQLPLDSAVPQEEEETVGEQQRVEAAALLPSKHSVTSLGNDA